VQTHAGDAEKSYGAVETARTGEEPDRSTAVKKMLTPLYKSLKREAELTPAAIMGDKARALTAIDRLMSAPENVPLMDAENALSTLKGLSRLKDGQIDAMRTPGQGAASVAVKQLQSAVDTAAIRGGVLKDLQAGRASTAAKFETHGVLESIHGEESVGAFKQLTRPKDESIGLLRSVTKQTPQVAPARRARVSGRFTRTGDGARPIRSRGQALCRVAEARNRDEADPLSAAGSTGRARSLLPARETDRGEPEPERDGAHADGAQLRTQPAGVGAISKLLYSPRGVRALTRFMSRRRRAATSRSTLRTAAHRRRASRKWSLLRERLASPWPYRRAAGITTTGAPER
jgi:hypothetical protein